MRKRPRILGLSVGTFAPGQLGKPSAVRLSYQAEIDGLRALAVLAVMLFHADLGVSGGFVGVDVFFVISGFLITRLIVEEVRAGCFSLADFWARRVRRVIPALALLLTATALPAFVLLSPDELKHFSLSAFASAALSANIFFWRSGGYFGLDEYPLLHLWTLGIEEQFYLLFPIASLLVLRYRSGLFVFLLTAAFLVSLVASELIVQWKSPASFYLLPTRGWELLLGALVANFVHGSDATETGRTGDAVAGSGLALILWSMLAFDEGTKFPGLWALLPTVGAALVIVGCQRGGLVQRLLAAAPLVGIGLISYSAYLWHQPMLAFARIAARRDLTAGEATIALLLSLVLGYLSWRFVEMPMRRRRLPPGKALALFVGVVGVTGAAALLVVAQAGFPDRFAPSALRYADVFPQYVERYAKRFSACSPQAAPALAACTLGRSGPQTIALVGDSHAGAFAPALDAILGRYHQRGIMIYPAGCPPMVEDASSRDPGECSETYESVVEYVKGEPDLETVVLSARWVYYLERSTYDNGEGGKEPRLGGAPLEPGERKHLERSVKRLVWQLLEAGKRVILVYPVPEAG